MRWLAGILIDMVTRGRNLDLPEERIRTGLIEGWFSILGNLLLAAIKAGAGLAVGSISLLADAAHTTSDIASSAVVIVGFKLSGKAPDKEHPYGHGRAEYLVGLAVAIMLVAVGGSFVVSSYLRLVGGQLIRPSFAAYLITLASIGAKELMPIFLSSWVNDRPKP